MIIFKDMKVNKKNYIAPVVEELFCAPMLLIGSALENGGNEWAEGDGTDQLSGEYRSDWENIWGNM